MLSTFRRVLCVFFTFFFHHIALKANKLRKHSVGVFSEKKKNVKSISWNQNIAGITEIKSVSNVNKELVNDTISVENKN